MAIIGISGKIGSGKDTVGKIIQGLIIGEDVFQGGVIGFLESYKDYETYPNKEWEIKKFATKLKQIVCLLTGCTMEQLEDQAFKNTYLPEEWDWYKTIGADSNGRPIYLRSPVTDVIRKEMGNRVYKTTYRELLQLLGTEALRHVIHENVHVNALFADYKSLDGHDIHSKYKELGGYGACFLPDNSIEKRSILENESGVKKELQEYIKLNSCNWLITDTRFPNEAKAIKDRGGIIIRIERPCEKKVNHLEHLSETSLDNFKFDYYICNDSTIENLVEQVKDILIKEKII